MWSSKLVIIRKFNKNLNEKDYAINLILSLGRKWYGWRSHFGILYAESC